MTFARWLSHQDGRDDTVGELARLLAHDLAIVSIGDLYPSLAAHVRRYALDLPGSLTIQGVLRRAWGEWVQSLQRADLARQRAERVEEQVWGWSKRWELT